MTPLVRNLASGFFHLLPTPDAEVSRIAASLHDKWKVERMAPGHCTGLPAFAALRALYKDKYLYAGLGTVIDLPQKATRPIASTGCLQDAKHTSQRAKWVRIDVGEQRTRTGIAQIRVVPRQNDDQL